MPLDITFTLSDQDLDHFQAIVDKAKSAMQEEHTAQAIEDAAKQLIADAKDGDLPDFIGDHIGAGRGGGDRGYPDNIRGIHPRKIDRLQFLVNDLHLPAPLGYADPGRTPASGRSAR